MAIPLDPKQVVSFEELLMSQVAKQEALTRLLVEKGYLPSRNSGDGDGFAEGEWIYNNDCVHHLDSGLQIVEVIDTWNWSYL